MDKIERFALKLGRLRALLKGAPDMSFSDPHAWTTISGGEGFGAKGKPQGKLDAIQNFASWAYVCIRLNAQACAAIPLELFARVPEGGKSWRSIKTVKTDRRTKARLAPKWRTKASDVEEVTDHAFLTLMENVNPFMNRSDLMELTAMFLDLTGEAYWYVIRAKVGVPVELWPLPSQYVTPVPGASFKDFIKGYKYERGSVRFEIPIEDMIAFSYPNPANPYRGMGIIRGISDAIYTNSQMYAFAEGMFENRARIGGILSSSADVSEKEVNRLREEWKQRYVGTDKTGSTIILPPGMTFDRDYVTPTEMDFIEGRRITREEIAAAFDTPIALWAQDAIRANVEGAQYMHAKYGIQPRLRKIEEKVNEKLLPMFDDSGVLFAAFDEVVPEDKAALVVERTGYVNAGVMTRNEVRTDMGLEPVDGADELFVPFSQVPIGETGQGASPADDVNESSAANPDDEADELAGKVVDRIREKLGVAK